MENVPETLNGTPVSATLRLDQYQAAAAFAPVDENVLITAGPGTGKTATLIARIVYLVSQGVDPASILVMTLTNRAAELLRERLYNSLQNSSVRVYTFHSFCSYLISAYGEDAGMNTSLSICETAEQAFIMSLASKQLDSVRPKPQAVKAAFNKRTQLIRDGSYEGRIPDSPELDSLVQNYETLLDESSLMDYNGLLDRGLKIVQSVQVKEFSHVLVDELQDTVPIQWKIIDNLVKRGLTAVGDPNQSIYGFLGAGPKVFDTMRKDYSPITKELTINYRATSQNTDLSMKVLETNKSKVAHFPRANTGQVPYGKKPLLHTAQSEHHEYAWISSMIHDLLKSNKELQPNDIAVLSRSKISQDNIKRSLTQRGHEAVSFGGTSVLDRPHISKILTFLKLLQNPYRDMLVEYIMRHPVPLMTESACLKLSEKAKQNHMSLWQCLLMRNQDKKNSSKRLTKFMEIYHECLTILAQAPYSSDALIECIEKFVKSVYTKSDAWRALKPPASLASDLETLYTFIKEVVSNSESENCLNAALSRLHSSGRLGHTNQITIATVHAAKGLEWPVVFVAGVTDTSFPHFMALQSSNTSQHDSAISEELRVLYVALTRARNLLILSHSKTTESMSHRLGYPLKTERSRFLKSPALNPYWTLSPSKTHFEKGSEWPYSSLIDARRRYPKLFSMPPFKLTRSFCTFPKLVKLARRIL